MNSGVGEPGGVGVGGRSLRGSPDGQGPHGTCLEGFVENGSLKLRVAPFTKQPRAIHCLIGSYLKWRFHCLKDYVTRGLLIACLHFNYLRKVEKRDDFFFT